MKLPELITLDPLGKNSSKDPNLLSKCDHAMIIPRTRAPDLYLFHVHSIVRVLPIYRRTHFIHIREKSVLVCKTTEHVKGFTETDHLVRVNLFEWVLHILHVGLVSDCFHLALIIVVEDAGHVDSKQEGWRPVLVYLYAQATALLLKPVGSLRLYESALTSDHHQV